MTPALILTAIDLPDLSALMDVEVRKLNGAAPDAAGRSVYVFTGDDREHAARIVQEMINSDRPPESVGVITEMPIDSQHAVVLMSEAQVVDRAPPVTRNQRAAKPGSSQSHAVVWQNLTLDCASNGQPHPTESNVLRIFTGHEEFADRIWLNEFSQQLMIDERPFQRTDAIELQIALQSSMSLHKVSFAVVERAALIAGKRNPRHPLRDWLTGLSWDFVERLPTMLADIWGTPQDDYHAAVGRCWLVSMVARVLRPGCKVDTMPVFEGPQGARKSTALNVLGGSYFSESHEDPVRNRKDFLGGLQGKWLVELAEMHAIVGRRDGYDAVKGILTCQIDNYRVPYGTGNMDFPRQCVLAGTTNREVWNPDQTGGRRFWPITCGEIDLIKLRLYREQLFAEAVYRFERGEVWHDVPDTDAREHQEARREMDEWESLIEQFVTHHPDRREVGRVYWEPRATPLPDLTVTQILADCLGIPEGMWHQSSQTRVAKCLQALGFRRVRLRLADGSRKWVYRRFGGTSGTYGASVPPVPPVPPGLLGAS